MKRTHKYAWIALAIMGCATTASAWFIYTRVPLVEFTPVHMGIGQDLQTASTPLTESQADSVEAVLQQYNERLRRKDRTTVLITVQLNMDQELIWNYTSKAGIE